MARADGPATVQQHAPEDQPNVLAIRNSAANDLIRRVRRHRTMYLFLLPAIVVVAVFAYQPMIGVIIAFQDFDISLGYIGSPFAGLKHFAEFIRDPEFFLALRNTAVINSLMIVVGFPMPILFALGINEIANGAFKRVTQTITYLPHFISWVVVAGMVYRMLDYHTGAVNELLNLLGVERIPFMREPRFFWGITVVVSVWKDLGWNSIIYLAALSSINPELYEAAVMDGAGRLRQVRDITIPGILPVISVMLIFAIGNMFNPVSGGNFDALFNLQNALVMRVSTVIEYYTYVEGIVWNNYSYASAIGLTQSVIALVMLIVANWASRRIRGYGAF